MMIPRQTKPIERNQVQNRDRLEVGKLVPSSSCGLYNYDPDRQCCCYNNFTHEYTVRDNSAHQSCFYVCH